MSKRETHMLRWYWQQVGGTLIEEFPILQRGKDVGNRVIDGLIVVDGENRIAKPSEVKIADKNILAIQVKNSRLGMSLMGQTLFSAELIGKFNPQSVTAVALCARDDAVLRPLLEAYPHCKVVVCPQEVCQLTAAATRSTTLVDQ